MAVLRKEHRNNYTVIDNEVFKSNLSLKARGLLSTMLSLPDNWNFSEKGLQAILPEDGQCAVHSAIKELESKGYLTRQRLCDDKGKVVEWVWTFSDYPQQNAKRDDANPQVTDFPQVNYPDVDFPDVDGSDVEDSHLEKPQQLSTKVSSTKESSKNASPSKAVPDVKHRHGEYGNVLLTDAELDKLKTEFPKDWSQRIERLSGYMEQTGKTYKSHLATIRNWARRDAEEGRKQAAKPKAAGSTDGGRRKRPTPEEIMQTHGVDYPTAQLMLFDGRF